MHCAASRAAHIRLASSLLIICRPEQAAGPFCHDERLDAAPYRHALPPSPEQRGGRSERELLPVRAACSSLRFHFVNRLPGAVVS